jgi:thioredoxin-like negative regulator of GroEL
MASGADRSVSLALAALLAAAALHAGAGPAPPPRSGSAGNGGNTDDPTNTAVPRWAADLKAALGKGKPVLLYVHASNEFALPSALKTPESAQASRGAFLFVRMPFGASEASLKDLNVVSAPVVLALDSRGNEWKRLASPTQTAIKDLLRNVPDEIARYEETVGRLADQARGREEKGDMRGALLILRKLAEEEYGDALILHAQRRSRGGDADGARAVLRRVAAEFAGTKAARQASAELGKR